MFSKLSRKIGINIIFCATQMSVETNDIVPVLLKNHKHNENQ